MDFSGVPREQILGRVLRFPLRLLPKEMVVPILQGPNRGLRWIVGSGTHGCWLGSYEALKQRRIAEVIRQGDVFYDLGANVGFYTLLASRLVGPWGVVVAFEPLPRNIIFLRRHVELNQCGNIKIFEVAVTRCAGTKRFEPGPDPSSGRLWERGAIEVRTLALDDAVTNRVIPQPNVMKIDIEGGEVLALEGAKRILAESKPTIFLSTHGPDVRAKCIELLKNIGYDVDSLDGRTLGEADEIVARAI